MGVDTIVLGLPSGDGLHVEGVAQDEGNALTRAEVGEPVPAEDALDANDEVVAIGLDGAEEEFGLRAQVAMQEDLAGLVVEDAEVHGTSVEVDSAVVSMVASVKAHGYPPGFDELLALSSFLPKVGRSRRGLHQYQCVASFGRMRGLRANRPYCWRSLGARFQPGK